MVAAWGTMCPCVQNYHDRNRDGQQLHGISDAATAAHKIVKRDGLLHWSALYLIMLQLQPTV